MAVGVGTTLGEKQSITLSLQAPSISTGPVIKKITAGSYNAIVIQGQKSTIDRPSTNMQQLMRNAELNEQGSAQFDDLMGQLLHNIGVLWFFNLVYEREFYATTLQLAYTSATSNAFITADLDVFYFFGIPRTVKEGFLVIDAKQDLMVMSALNGENKRKKDFMILSGMTGSAWEHLIFESLFNVPGASAVKLLQLATAQGVPVYKIDKSNIDQILPLLVIPGDDLADIVNAVNAGLEVTVSQKGVQLGTYSGVGYIVLDPITGAGPYYLSGGLAGGVAFTLEVWKKDVYNKIWVSLLARNLVLNWARGKIGAPYGFGCKDTFVHDAQSARCAGEYGTDTIRIDCSGLIEFAYYMVGFNFFVGKNAQGQYNFVKGNFNLPSPNTVLFGDLVFFENTYDKNSIHRPS